MLDPRSIALQGLVGPLSAIAMAVQGFIASLIPPSPENGPSGGANWLRGYKPEHDYSPKRRRNRRDELLICRA